MFLVKVIRDHLATHKSRREPVESYCEDSYNDEEPIEKVIYVHEVCKFDDDSLYLDDLFRDDLVTYTPPEEKVESCCEDVCMADEPIFLDKLFKDECDHSDEKTRVEDFKSGVPFEKRKLDLSIFTFDEPTNDQSRQNISQEDMVTHTYHMEQFEDECDKNELIFQAKFEDEFNKFCKENFIEKQKISSN